MTETQPTPAAPVGAPPPGPIVVLRARFPMASRIGERIILGIGLLLASSILIFAGIEILPGDFAETYLGQAATPQAIANLRAEFGLDHPVARRIGERELHRQRRAVHYKRILEDGAIYSQPFSEGGDAAAGKAAFGTTAVVTDGGWIVNGKKIFASLSGHADYYGILCGEMKEGERPSRRDTMYIAVPATAEGVEVVGPWDPLGMRGTVSRTLIFRDVFIPFSEQLMPRGVYFNAARQWPHMFMTLTPSYMGIAQAAYDFTVRYLRGEMPGTPPVKRRMHPTKQLAVAQMKIVLEQTKSLWFQSISEARPNPGKDAILRAWAAQYSVMENANEIAQLAIRTCGGQAMLKSLHLERLYRDSRCGSLMLPWTAELCTDMLGKGVLYEAGESDED